MPSSLDTSQILGDILALVNATGAGDLNWWTADEVYAWFDEGARKMARTAAVFVSRETSTVTVNGTGEYALPAAQIATVQADLDGKVLRPATAQEIEALDANWPNTVGKPLRFTQQGQAGTRRIVLYPAPDTTGQVLGLVMHQWPAAISLGSPTVAAPPCMREFFLFYGMGELRGKETRGAMPEVADWYRGLADMMLDVSTQYWGKAQ